jgi:hypothetical protein
MFNHQIKGGNEMKRLSFIYLVTFFVILIGSSYDIAYSASIESQFDSGDEGWTAYNAEITYEPSGGNSGGYLYIRDTEDDTFYVTVPNKFYGDLTDFDGGFISYEVISPVPLSEVGSGFGRIQISGNGLNVTFDYGAYPAIPSNESWTKYLVPMNAAAWKTTQPVWENVLSNVTSMTIILEPWNGYSIKFDNFKLQSFLEIAIDIKPGDDTNSINLRSKTVPVAILSSTYFDAPTEVEIDRLSLTFGSKGDEQSLSSCQFRKPKDVNGDGLKDLVCQFSIKDTGFRCGDVGGILRGTTVTGTLFEGSQNVLIAPCK